MKFKEFTMEFPGRGKVDVSFYLHFDTGVPSVGEIKIRPDFDSTLPHRAWLKQDNGVWKLFDEHPSMQGGSVAVNPEFLDDEVSHAIAQKILDVKAGEG